MHHFFTIVADKELPNEDHPHPHFNHHHHRYYGIVQSEDASTVEKSSRSAQQMQDRDDIDAVFKYRFPFFFRMECEVLGSAKPSLSSSSSTADTRLPSPRVYPVQIGTSVERLIRDSRQLSRVVLRLVCITLPVYNGKQQQRMNNAIAAEYSQAFAVQEGMKKSHSMSSFQTVDHPQSFNTNQSLLLTFSQLPEDVRRRMVKVSKALRAAISEEMLSSLLLQNLNVLHNSSHERALIVLITKHLQRIRSDRRIQRNLHLDIVNPDISTTTTLFSEELSRTCFRLVHLTKSRVCFYLPPQQFYKLRHLGNHDGNLEKAALAVTDTTHDVTASSGDDEVDAAQAPSNVLFWLLVFPTEERGHVDVWLYSDDLESEFIEELLSFSQGILNATACRVSQLVLLSSLHQTRICSDLLLPRREDDPQQDPDRTTRLSTSPRQSNFTDGKFACPCVHRMHIQLHERLPAAVALQTLADTALHPFMVTNRRHMFVYQEKSGSVFFLKLSVYNNFTSPVDESETDPSSVSGHINVAEMAGLVGHDSSVSEPSSRRSLSKHMFAMDDNVPIDTTSLIAGDVKLTQEPDDAEVNALENRECLLVQVFGVDKPGAEIFVQLQELLSSKIDSITVAILSSVLARNATFKCSSADLELLRPRDSAPARAFMMNLPDDIDDGYLFLLFLSQNLSQYLSPLHFANTSASPYALSTSQLISKKSLLAPVLPSNNDAEAASPSPQRRPKHAHWSWSDFAFVYNYDRRYEASKSVGSGLSSVFCSLVVPQGPQPIRKARTRIDLSGGSSCPYFESLPEISETFQAKMVELPKVLGGISRMDDEDGFSESSSSDDDSLDDDKIGSISWSAEDSATQSGRAVMIEVWKLGGINVDALVSLLFESFRQVVADYRVEVAAYYTHTRAVNLDAIALKRRVNNAVDTER